MNQHGISNQILATGKKLEEILSTSSQISSTGSTVLDSKISDEKQSIMNDLSQFFGDVLQTSKSLVSSRSSEDKEIKNEINPEPQPSLENVAGTNASDEEDDLSGSTTTGDKTHWNIQDDQKLLEIVNNAPKGFNWDAIHATHFPNRTPRSLVGRYQALRRKKAFSYVNGIVKVSKMYLKRNKIVINEVSEAHVNEFIKRPSTPWTKADNAKFLQLIEGKEPKTINWAEMTKEFTNRPEYNLQCKFRQMKKYHFFEVVNGLVEITKPKRRNQLRAEDKRKQGKSQRKKNKKDDDDDEESSGSEIEEELDEDSPFELKKYETKSRRKSQPIIEDQIDQDVEDLIVEDEKGHRVVWTQSDLSLFKEVYHGLGSPEVPNFRDFCDVLPDKSIRDCQALFKMLLEKGEMKNE